MPHRLGRHAVTRRTHCRPLKARSTPHCAAAATSPTLTLSESRGRTSPSQVASRRRTAGGGSPRAQQASSRRPFPSRCFALPLSRCRRRANHRADSVQALLQSDQLRGNVRQKRAAGTSACWHSGRLNAAHRNSCSPCQPSPCRSEFSAGALPVILQASQDSGESRAWGVGSQAHSAGACTGSCRPQRPSACHS